MKPIILLLFAAFAVAQPSRAAAATPERIFANGFDPCCRIGGTVTGLAGSGLVLHLATGSNIEDKPVAGNGLYDFAASVAPGTSYTLGVTAQPSGQTCTLSSTGGTMGSADVADADVSCADTPRLIWDTGTWGRDWN